MQQGAARRRILAPSGNISGRIFQLARTLGSGHDNGDAAVDRHVAIVKAERFGDPAGIEIILARHWLRIEKCAWIEVSVAPAVERQRRQGFARRTITMHITLPRQCMPLDDTAASPGRHELSVAGGPWCAAATAAGAARLRTVHRAPYQHIVAGAGDEGI